MKILVFSDSHGNLSNLELILTQYRENTEYVIHLGDYDSDISEMKTPFPNYKYINISGNCDWGNFTPSEKFFSLRGKNFFITHGHKYRVKLDLIKLPVWTYSRSYAHSIKQYNLYESWKRVKPQRRNFLYIRNYRHMW